VNRKVVTFQNQGAGTFYAGPAGVTATGATTGYAIATGTSFTDNASAEEWWIIAASPTAVHVIDVI
jgi:hypothetical protein